MKSKAIIKLEDVWKIYQMGNIKVNALQGINLEIKEGEFAGLTVPLSTPLEVALNGMHMGIKDWGKSAKLLDLFNTRRKII